MTSNRSRLLASIAMLASMTAGGLAACGGDDGQPVDDADAGDTSSLDAAAPTPPPTPPPPPPPPPQDGGSDAATADASGDAEAGCSLTLTGVAPNQGYGGLDIPVTISGSGFATCDGADAGDAGCPDRFKLVASCGDGGIDAGACADAGDGGTFELPLKDVRVTSSDIAMASVPAGGPVGGPYRLVDTQNLCTAELANAYTILPASISVTSITPSYGWKGDDTPVTITGTDFVSTPTAYIRVPGMTPEWRKLRNTGFVSATSLTSTVEKGLTAGGPYDVAVLNPDGTGGTLVGAFRVVDNPVPRIDALSPASITTSELGVADNVTITGCNFRAPLKVATVSSNGVVVEHAAGAPSCAGPATCPGGTNVCTLKTTISGLTTGPYVVRVTNQDENTAGEYSVLVVSDPSAKLSSGFTLSGKALNTPRRSLATVAGRIDDASRFLYAVGGEAANGAPIDTVEVAPLDRFGTLGDWFVQRNKLLAPRSGAAVVRQGKYVYVLGGTSSTGGTGGATPNGVPLATTERAKILDATDIPKPNAPTVLTTGNLAKGTWYYQIVALRSNADPDNPGGEGLPSEEIVVTLPVKGSAVLSWTAPSNAANIAKYRIYRTPAVNGTSQTEVLLGETPDGVTTTFTDNGSAVPGAQKPLVRGSTGVFVASKTLGAARFNAGATIAADPNGQRYVYLVGGHGKCAGVATQGPMDCYELASISADGSTLGDFTAGTTKLGTGRGRHGVATMDASNGVTPWTGNASFVFVSGGAGLAQPLQRVEYAAVSVGGQLGTWSYGNSFYGVSRDGSQLQIANGYLYAFFGGGPGNYSGTADLANAISQTASTVTLASWSNASSQLPGMATLGRMGMALESAYFYVVGGTSDDTDAKDTVYFILY